MMSHQPNQEWLHAIWTRPHLTTPDGTVIHLRRTLIGELVAPSGTIVSHDPGYGETELKPFEPKIPPGLYPVEVIIASIDGWPDERIAAACLVVSNKTVATWEQSRGRGYYSVETGQGSFMDLAAYPKLRTVWDNSPGTSFREQYLLQFDANYQPTRTWVNTILDPESGSNIITFTSGVGDGDYACYTGLDASGQVVAFLHDFEVVDRAFESCS